MKKYHNEKDAAKKWNEVYRHFPGKDSVWADLNFTYGGASSYIVEKIIQLPKSAKILDAGCGDGRNLIYLVKAGYKVSGIDISKEAIGRAKNKLAEKGLGADLRVGNLYCLLYQDTSFDAIVYDFTNVHIEKPEKVLREFYRALKPDGLLLFETTSKNDPLYKGKDEFYAEGFYFKFYGRKEVGNLVKKYFKVKEVENNTVHHRHHGKSYAARKKHYHKSYLVIASKAVPPRQKYILSS